MAYNAIVDDLQSIEYPMLQGKEEAPYYFIIISLLMFVVCREGVLGPFQDYDLRRIPH
jgi:hypothetical protein